MRKPLVDARRVVVKVGSSLLLSGGARLDGARLDVDYIGRLSAQIAAQAKTREFVIVSSGAVAAGVRRLRWPGRPAARVDVQVAAAVGQMGLINAYEDAFVRHNLHAAQVLLTAEDMAHRTLYLNARATLKRMLARDIVPVINENDVIATDAVRFGDNDRLAAQIANLLEADVLLMLTDVPGLCRDGARLDGEGLSDVVAEARAADDSLFDYVDGGGGGAAQDGVGSGGMRSKLEAARIAGRSGAHSLIVDGRAADCVTRALSGDDTFGTLLIADMPRLSARKQWLGSGLHVRGRLVLDAGAVAALVGGKRSLLPAGVASVAGDFIRGDAVLLVDGDGGTVGYALANYGAQEAAKLCGVNSAAIAGVLGYKYEEEMAHRDNMTILR